MSRTDLQEFDSLRVEGGLFPGEFLNNLRALTLKGQASQDYGLHRTLKLRDEIGRYWRMATAEWETFADIRQREDVQRDKLTRERFLEPLLKAVFGFEALTRPPALRIGERQFPITHLAFGNVDEAHVPLVLVGPEHDLDKSDPLFGDDGRRRSPQGLMQEYLNATDEALWGIVSNGEVVRILRDNPSMTRPAFIEIDLTRLFGDDLYADFVAVWLLLHASRFAPQQASADNCWLEQWRQEAAEQGERARESLRDGVEGALRALGTGFLAHPANQALRDAIQAGELSDTEFFQQLLRMVYRLLFLITAEDRRVLHPPEAPPEARALYAAGYSLSLLRERARRRRFYDQYDDIWAGLSLTFDGLAAGQPALGLPALGGLFASDKCPALDTAKLGNKALLNAIRAITWVSRPSGATRINYRDMDTEELGSVYESLLELIPRINPATTPWAFGFVGDDAGANTQGHARKTTGSYYTPDALVQELIRSALLPVMEQRLQENPASPRDALLDIKVCDPACGSGHFLLAAARKLAARLAELDAAGDQYTDQQFRHALREVVQKCIYGVDLNPMAVELCKTALWIETLEPGKPLGFLDAHIRCGNALVGVFDPAVLEQGIPDDAFKPLTGDDKDIASAAKKLNKANAKKLAISLHMPRDAYVQVEAMPEETVEEVAAKQAAWREAEKSDQASKARQLEDIYTAAFFVPKDAEHEKCIPTNASLMAAWQGEVDQDLAREVQVLAQVHGFFHWRLAFGQVFDRSQGGFDVLLGNPPWERIKLQEKEFFAARHPDIAGAINAAARQRLITALASGSESEKRLFNDFQLARRAAEASSLFVRAGRFPLTGTGDVNLYALFAEQFLKAIGIGGRAGVIVPTGISTDDSTKVFFGHITTEHRLASLYDFENREGIFNGVHRSYKFCLLTLADNVEQANLLFFATQVAHLKDDRRMFQLAPEDFALINPNTLTCPVFRSRKDAELTRKIYRRAPVLMRDADDSQPGSNPWQIKFQAMFHMSNDSGLFRTLADLDAKGAVFDGNHLLVGETRYLPLYEAKMVHHYDHRWATYERDGETSRDMTLEEKQNPDALPLPRYWVDQWQVVMRTTDAPAAVLKPWRKDEEEAVVKPLTQWAVGAARALGHAQQKALEALVSGDASGQADDLFGADVFAAADSLQSESPLDAEGLELLAKAALAGDKRLLLQCGREVLTSRCPGYLLGWRDICRSTDERTVIAGFIPLAGVGNSFPLMLFPKNLEPKHIAALSGNLTSLVFDFVARHKVGGTHLNFFIYKQLPVLPPGAYSDSDLQYICERVVVLACTALDMEPLARALGFQEASFEFQEASRHQRKCELDAYFAHLYSLTREELRYILEPADVMGDDYPSETFRGLKNNELKRFGEYRTQRLVLEAYDSLASQFASRAGQVAGTT